MFVECFPQNRKNSSTRSLFFQRWKQIKRKGAVRWTSALILITQRITTVIETMTASRRFVKLIRSAMLFTREMTRSFARSIPVT